MHAKRLCTIHLIVGAFEVGYDSSGCFVFLSASLHSYISIEGEVAQCSVCRVPQKGISRKFARFTETHLARECFDKTIKWSENNPFYLVSHRCDAMRWVFEFWIRNFHQFNCVWCDFECVCVCLLRQCDLSNSWKVELFNFCVRHTSEYIRQFDVCASVASKPAGIGVGDEWAEACTVLINIFHSFVRWLSVSRCQQSRWGEIEIPFRMTGGYKSCWAPICAPAKRNGKHPNSKWLWILIRCQTNTRRKR